ncbi:DNA helicase [Trifolium repens]|nr:DNA helicase [Trifolium repens]
METNESNPLQKMKDFIGYNKVRKFKELLTSVDGGVFAVVAWFVSVDEGVDCWFPDVNVKSKLRFRMKLKVRDGKEVAIFSLFDSDVECLAMETCPLLNSMGESCSLFPDEMECFLCLSFLFDARFCPLLLDSLLGLRIVAKGRWSPTFRSMFVDSFSTDKELFEVMEAKYVKGTVGCIHYPRSTLEKKEEDPKGNKWARILKGTKKVKVSMLLESEEFDFRFDSIATSSVWRFTLHEGVKVITCWSFHTLSFHLEEISQILPADE